MTATTASTRCSRRRARSGTSLGCIGKWDDPTAQKVTADAIAVHKKFDAITAQGGDTGVVQAMIDAKHPFVPFGGETENGFRKFCGKHGAQGLKCASAGTGPAQVAVAIKVAIAALEGKVVPQSVKLPLAKASCRLTGIRAKLVLPIPGSPASSTTVPCPAIAWSSPEVSSASSRSRPTRVPPA